jgi:outer membrane protein TolC
MEKKSRAELVTWHCRLSEMQMPHRHCPEGIDSLPCGPGANGAARYQQSIQGAFRSVWDALVAYRKTREFRIQEELLFESAQDTGVTGYLEVLTNETNAFAAELALVQARQNELLALVKLYEALGGGWQQ